MHRYVKRTLVLVVLAALGGLAGAFIPAGSATPAAPHASKAKVTVKVTMSEWKFKLSKRTVPAGSTVVFKVTNKGKIPHDFKIDGKKTPLLKPGKSAKLVVTLKKGKNAYICSVAGHAALGMKGNVTGK